MNFLSPLMLDLIHWIIVNAVIIGAYLLFEYVSKGYNLFGKDRDD